MHWGIWILCVCVCALNFWRYTISIKIIETRWTGIRTFRLYTRPREFAFKHEVQGKISGQNLGLLKGYNHFHTIKPQNSLKIKFDAVEVTFWIIQDSACSLDTFAFLDWATNIHFRQNCHPEAWTSTCRIYNSQRQRLPHFRNHKTFYSTLKGSMIRKNSQLCGWPKRLRGYYTCSTEGNTMEPRNKRS